MINDISPVFFRKPFLNFYLIALVSISLTSCKPSNDEMHFPGYVEGNYVYISSSFPGILDELYVHRGEHVKIHQKLFLLDSTSEKLDLEAANARLKSAQADLAKIQEEFNLQKTIFERKNSLFNQKVVTKQDFDSVASMYQQTKSSLESSKYNLTELKAKISKIEWILAQKSLPSPVVAVVADTYYSKGENVPASSPILSLLPAKVKIIFNCPENYISRLKINQLISVACDNCESQISAKITYISNQSEFTPPVLYSKEMRSKLSYHIEASLISSKNTLNPGQPVSIIVGN